MDELLSELKITDSVDKTFDKIVDKSKSDDILLTRNDFSNMVIYCKYIINLFVPPFSPNLIYKIINDKHISEHTDLRFDTLKSNPFFLILAMDNTKDEVKEFYANLYKNISKDQLFLHYSTTIRSIELGMYTGDEIVEYLIGNVHTNASNVICELITNGKVENLNKMYNLAIQHDRNLLVRRLNKMIMNQV